MILPALLFVALSYYQMKLGLTLYADMFIPSSSSDLVYGFGKPTSRVVSGNSEIWSYAGEGQKLSATLENGRLSRITCEVTSATGLCPELLGVGSKTPENEVWVKLGAPTWQRYSGDAKYLGYDDIGLVLGLTRFSVFSVSPSDQRSGFFAYLGRFFRLLIP